MLHMFHVQEKLGVFCSSISANLDKSQQLEWLNKHKLRLNLRLSVHLIIQTWHAIHRFAHYQRAYERG